MATIQVKRGLQENVEKLVLAQGEPAVAVDTGNMYIGTTAGKILVNPAGGIADEAVKLKTAREFSVTGDGVSPAVSFDGTQNIALALYLAVMPGLTAGTYTKLTVDTKGRVTGAFSIAVEDLPDIPAAKVTGLGSAAGLDTGTTAGKIVVVGADGKLPEEILPALSISDTYEAVDEAAMLALAAQKGDLCIRADEGKSYILAQSPATSLENWKWLKTPDCKVLSVSGKTGAVTLTAADVGARPASWMPTAADVGAAPLGHVDTKATGAALGHVKAGAGLAVDADGVLSVDAVDGGSF